MSNLLVAIKNIIECQNLELKKIVGAKNRANAEGDALESFIKDSFTNTFGVKGKNRWTNKCFSYLGNSNNPPDIMIKGGDAIEVKKVESLNNNELQLNSSYPKDKLRITNTLISNEAKNCEEWSEKEMLYCIGFVPDKEIRRIWFVYGDCFCAKEEVYSSLKKKIIDGIKNIEGVDLEETNELGRINNVDPLGYTKMRIRGMWLLKNPNKIFEGMADYDKDADFQLFALMKKEKYDSFPKKDREALEKMKNEHFILKNVDVPNPNNPAKTIECKLISYTKK